MLDIKFVRDNPDTIKKALRDRSAEFDLDYFLDLDERRRAKIQEVDDLRGRQNKFADAIAKSPADARAAAIEESRALKDKLGHSEFELKVLEEEFDGLARRLPNIPLPEVPVGKNVVLRKVGKEPNFAGYKNVHGYMTIAGSLD